MLIFPCVIYKIRAVDLLVNVNIRREYASEFVIYIHMRFYASTGFKLYVTRSIASFPSLSFFRIQRSLGYASSSLQLKGLGTYIRISTGLFHSDRKTISTVLFRACYMSIASHSPVLSP
jgi:hypothetical protein